MKIEKSCNHCETICITCDRRKKNKNTNGDTVDTSDQAYLHPNTLNYIKNKKNNYEP